MPFYLQRLFYLSDLGLGIVVVSFSLTKARASGPNTQSCVPPDPLPGQ